MHQESRGAEGNSVPALQGLNVSNQKSWSCVKRTEPWKSTVTVQAARRCGARVDNTLHLCGGAFAVEHAMGSCT